MVYLIMYGHFKGRTKMRIKKVYFSPTGNCKKIADEVVKTLTTKILDVQAFDLARPGIRQKEICVNENEILVIVMPIYASRLPNKIMPFIRENLIGKGAKAIAMVSYGNRSYGDGLAELCGILKDNGFEICGAAAVPSEHAFASKLANGRPDLDDLKEIADYVKSLGVDGTDGSKRNLVVKGNYPPGEYYRPLKKDGTPAIFLKATPLTDPKKCMHCGYCALACPMGSIHSKDSSRIEGICIKCQACVKICKMQAKYFDNEDFLSHKDMLEETFTDRKEIEFFY